ncbi:MAG: hypothetical protein K6E51_13730 [Treponema sp.]|nr:hypothetical protein [Treponema sp.]
MAKITAEVRELYAKRILPYAELVKKSLEKEKSLLELIEKDTAGVAYKKLLLSDEMIYVATLYMMMNSLSLRILQVKNNDALNDARKALYKAIIYLEEIVTNIVDVPYGEIEDKVLQIANTPLDKRYYHTRKLGLAIQMLIDAFGDNSKWKWSFVELEGRFIVVAKNMLDMKKAIKDFFDPRSADYDNTVYYLRLINTLLQKSAAAYRDRYELSTRRIDDIRMAINFLLAQRRLAVAMGKVDEGEEIKKKAMVWKEKMDADHKQGLSK